MNLRQKNKKLKRELELSKQRVEYLERSFDVFRRDVVASERLEIDTLKVSYIEIEDGHYRDNQYYRCISDSLTIKLARELNKYIDVKKSPYFDHRYPMSRYEATIRVVRPERNCYGLSAEVAMADQFHDPKI